MDIDDNIRVVAVSAGASHSLALLSNSDVCSWGRGEDGQLGHGDAEERHFPTAITALDDLIIDNITCGADHTLAYSTSSKLVYSWGWGDFGRLGHGNSTDVFIPQSIKALGGLSIRQIACGDCHCLAITGDGQVYSWGRNQNGQLGIGNNDDALLPTKIDAFQGIKVKMVAAGAEHTACVTEDGHIYCWGWGRYGNLGLGDREDRYLPHKISAVENEEMVSVSCGWRHTICVSKNGSLFTFGWSKYGQLGHGDFNDRLTPSPVLFLKDLFIAQTSGGWRHTVALDSNGHLYAWGWNKFGQVGVGNNEDQNSPQLLETLTEKIVQVSCGWRHTIAISENGNVFSWGRGTSGQLGHGDNVDRSLPKRIEALSADGLACENIPRSKMDQNWISPSERYAVVPDENGNFGSNFEQSDASVPSANIKRRN